MKKSLFKSTGLVSSFTMISRGLGFVRDMVLAHLFGAGAGLDAFLVAFKIPNFMRRLFAEGAFSQAFVPVLSEYQQQKPREQVQQFIQSMSGMLAAVLLVTCVLAQLLAPLFVAVFAPGFLQDPNRFALSAMMLRITFPYLLLISLTAFAGAVLNTNQRFGPPAITPVLLNIALILAATCFAPWFEQPVVALAWGVLLAGVAQFLFLLPFVWRLGYLRWPKLDWHHRGVRQVLRLMVPALLGVSVAQISLLLDTLFASFLPPGSVSWLYYSDRITSLPLGVFGVAIATVVLPHLSKQHASQNNTHYAITLDWGIRLVLLIGLPAAVGLIFLAQPILTALFQYGEFTLGDVLMAKRSMLAYAAGIPSFMLIKILASGYYAQQEIKTPVRFAMVALVTNMTLNAALIIPLQHAGLALATTLASTLNAALLWRGLSQRGTYKNQPGFMLFVGRLLLANTVMAALLFVSNPPATAWMDWSWPQRVSHLFLLILLAVIGYFTTLYVIGMRWAELKKLSSTVSS